MFYLCAWLRGSPDAACPPPLGETILHPENWEKRDGGRRDGWNHVDRRLPTGLRLTEDRKKGFAMTTSVTDLPHSLVTDFDIYNPSLAGEVDRLNEKVQELASAGPVLYSTAHGGH